MAGKFEECIRKAVAVVDESTQITGEDKQKIKDALGAIADDSSRSQEGRIISIEHSMRNVQKDLHGAAAAQKKAEEFVETLSSGQFDFNPASSKSIQEALDNVLRYIVPRRGNVGFRERPSMTNEIEAEKALLRGELAEVMNLITDTRVFQQDSEMAPLFMRAMLGDEVSDPRIKAAVAQVRESTRARFKRMNAAGSIVEELENWFPQNHDLARIRSDLPGWRAFLAKNLDPERHPDPEATAEALMNALSREGTTEDAGVRIGVKRVFHFKDAKAQREYWERYGSGEVGDLMKGMIERLATDTVVAERLSPRPKAVVEQVTNRIIRAANKLPDTPRNRKRVNKIKKEAAWTRDFVGWMNEPMYDPVHHNAQNWFRAGRLYFASNVLGKVAINQAVEDPMIAALNRRLIPGAPGFARGFAEQFTKTGEVLANKTNLKDSLRSIGVYLDASQAQTVARLSADIAGRERFGGDTLGDRAAGGAAQALQAVQRFSSTSVMEQGQRAGAFAHTWHDYSMAAARTWDDLPAGPRRQMIENNGITKADWQKLNKARRDAMGGIDRDALRQEDPELFRKFFTAMWREAQIQIAMPDLAARFQLTGNLPMGIKGELLRNFTQFFAWPLTTWRNTMVRQFQTSPMTGLSATVGLTTAHAFVMQARFLASFRPTFAWSSPTLWVSAFAGSAALGPYVPMMFQAVGATGFGPDISAGLVPEKLQEIAVGTYNTTNAALVEQETDKAAKEALELFRGFVPNVWYIDGAVNKATDEIIRELDPAYIRRRDRRWERQGREVN